MKIQENKSNFFDNTTIDMGRRKAICKIAAGVGALAGISVLPEQWTRPIIGQIVLPAHAQTSGVNGIFGNSITGFGKVNPAGNKFLDSLAGAADSALDFFVADAHAASAPVSRPNYMCVTLTGNAVFALLAYNLVSSGLSPSFYSGTGTVSGGVTVIGKDSLVYTITITSASSSKVDVRIVNGSYDNSFSLVPQASCAMPA